MGAEGNQRLCVCLNYSLEFTWLWQGHWQYARRLPSPVVLRPRHEQGDMDREVRVTDAGGRGQIEDDPTHSSTLCLKSVML